MKTQFLTDNETKTINRIQCLQKKQSSVFSHRNLKLDFLKYQIHYTFSSKIHKLHRVMIYQCNFAVGKPLEYKYLWLQLFTEDLSENVMGFVLDIRLTISFIFLCWFNLI